jgi:ribosomal protein S27AE
MQPPRKDFRNKTHFDTSEDFFDRELGWVKRLSEPCPKCRSENTMAHLEEQGFTGCTNCLYVGLLEGFAFREGGYSEARKILETLFDERRIQKPVQYRFMPMHFKRN